VSNPASQVQRDIRHAQRLRWLREHPDVLARLPGAMDDVEPDQSAALGEALALMKAARLYAPTSSTTASRWGIRLCVSELRGQVVTGRDQRWRS
jgi:hypothetical protein